MTILSTLRKLKNIFSRERNKKIKHPTADLLFQNIKIKLLDTKTGKLRNYELSELITSVYKSNRFKFRGSCTGIKDIHGQEIYEFNLLKNASGRIVQVIWFQSSIHCGWDLKAMNSIGKPSPEWCTWDGWEILE